MKIKRNALVISWFLVFGSIASFAQQLDWGDAPATYATRKADNGPRHVINPALRLGKLIDAEANGLPSANANGDDLDGVDDDDGIVSAGPMIVGQSVSIGIEASAAGFLDAWIDFNRNGDFADAGEKIFDRQALAAGTNNFTLLIPAGAAPGDTAARLRLSSAGGLSFDGLAADGEVEDYRVTLLPAATPSTNVSAHYANGQVWVVWNVEPSVLNNCLPTLTPALSNGVPVVISNCLPQTYAIYWSERPITNTTTATLIGRLFAQEWSGFVLRDDVNAAFGVRPTGFRIPDGAGGYRTLSTNEGVFVHTVRSSFVGHYAVRPFGTTDVPAEWRTGPITAAFSLADPPTCHLQATGSNDGYPIEWWTMWADGDTNLAAARPDFPIMENDKRRGVPHNFSVTFPKTGPLPATNIPACIALHSGDAQAKMWLPENDGFKNVGLAPVGELLVATEDRFFSIHNNAVDAETIASTGYVPSFDPFFNHLINPVFKSPPDKLPASNEIIYPYPVFRLNWTLDWLYAHKNVDSNRVAVVGHSGGAKSSMLWSHANPERFAYVGLYNPALGQFPKTDARLIGTLAQNLPMLLTNHTGQLVRAADIHIFTASYSPLRDLPFTRMFFGKREENWVLDENQDTVADIGALFRQNDALALGAVSFWDLRRHGVDTWAYLTLSNDVAHPKTCRTNLTVDLSGSWSIQDLWIPTINSQYRRDDGTNQIRHRADSSYPAFFHCESHGGHGDVGSVIYTNNSFFYQDSFPYDGLVTTTECLPPWTGDARGTWGGYCDWEPNITDTTTNWSAVLFLVGTPSAFNPIEICPDASRVMDVAIRRPQRFKPATGSLIDWRMENASNSSLLQSGQTVVGADGLVSVPNLTIPRDPQRVRLVVSVPIPTEPPATCEPLTLEIQMIKDGVFGLRWQACTNYSYQLECSDAFANWAPAAEPIAAPAGGGWITNIVRATSPTKFYRVRADLLTNSPVPTEAGLHRGLSVAVAGLARTYSAFIPANYDPAVPNAFALILHGHTQSAETFTELHPGLFLQAQTNNLILALPDGSSDPRGRSWNNYQPPPGEYHVDDVSFLLGLIEHLSTTLTLDRTRLYAGGFSAGGSMSHYLGARTTNVFAALAAVESAIGEQKSTNAVIVTNPPAAGPMPVLILNCTNSCTRPYWGGANDDGHLQAAAIDAAYYWTNANFCAAAMTATTNSFVTNGMYRFNNCDNKPPAIVPQPNQVIVQRWGDCSPETEVIFVTLTDGGHTWPDRKDNLGYDANTEVLRFFLRHSRP